jgi:hypothetical protein
MSDVLAQMDRAVAQAVAAYPPPLAATPFEWADDIKPREWIYGTHMIRKYVSLIVAPGGVGKSSWVIGEAICMASNRDLLGDEVHQGSKRVWVYNLEDPRDELQMRVQAFMSHHGISMKDIAGRLYVDSGRDQELCIAMEDRDGSRLIHPIIDQIVAEIQRRKIDVVIIDPFVSSHRINENDNGAIDMVAKAWGRVADAANCAVVLVHHTRKMTAGRHADAESARGAVSLIGAARSVRVFSRLSESEAAELGITESAGRYGKWYDDKNNLAPCAGRERYYHMVSHTLPNGESVGVPVLHDVVPPRKATFTDAELNKIYEAMGEEHGANPQSSDSLSRVAALALGHDPLTSAGRDYANAAIKYMVKLGMVEHATGLKPNRHPRPVYRKCKPTASTNAMEQPPSDKEDLFA